MPCSNFWFCLVYRSDCFVNEECLNCHQVTIFMSEFCLEKVQNMHVSAFKYYLPSLNHAEFDKNSVILSNLQLEQTVKVTAMLICTQN